MTRTRRKRRRLFIAATALLLCIVAALLIAPVAMGRTKPCAPERESANQAFSKAIDAGTKRWAPAALAAAEAKLLAAEREYRRQEGRFVSFRAFELARRMFVEADLLAQGSMREATEARVRAASDTRALIAETERAAIALEPDAERVNLPKDGRGKLTRARFNLDHAKGLVAREEYTEARKFVDMAVKDVETVRGRIAEIASRFTNSASVGTWRRWVDDTVRDSRRSKGYAIVVLKERHEVVLYKAGRAVKRYSADMGRNRTADKARAGDRATPEGRYKIIKKKDVGHSKYHRALLLDYPNEDDKRQFAQMKARGLVPRGASPGNLIEIHGHGGRNQDWTDGCVALADPDMDDLFRRVPLGTPVTIVGGLGQGGTFSEIARRMEAAR